jgi:23S rRNA G2445 N2-methylase RlmL
MPGLEQVAWLEIRKRFPKAAFKEFLYLKDKNGIVVFDHAGPPGELLGLRTTEDVFVLALAMEGLTRDWGDLRTLAGQFRDSRLFDLASRVMVARDAARPTYRIVTRKEGQHAYRRKDFEQAILKGLDEQRSTRWKRVEEDADLEVWANLLGSRLLCGLRLSDRTMRHRDYKRDHVPASLRPSVAAALAVLTGPGDDDLFVDPMCGGGTILVERLLAGPSHTVIGGDIDLGRARAARRNLAQLAPDVPVCRWDACALPLRAGSVSGVAANLPFGKQIGTREAIERLYPCFIAELDRILKPGGTAVLLSSEYDLLKEVLRTCPGLTLVRGYAVAVLGQWGRIYILRKVLSSRDAL